MITRALLTLALCLGLAAPSWGAITLVQSKLCADGGGANSKTQTCQFTNPTTTGNVIIVGAVNVTTAVAITAMTFTDDASGSSYTTNKYQQAGTTAAAAIGSSHITTGATTTVTATVTATTGGTTHAMCLMEYSGVDETGGISDNSTGTFNGAFGTGTDAVSSGAAVPTVDNDLFVGMIFIYTNLTSVLTAGTGYTERQNSNSGTQGRAICEDFQQSGAKANKAATATLNAGAGAIPLVMALKTAAVSMIQQSSGFLGAILP